DPIGSASESFTQRLLELRPGIPQIESEGNPPEEIVGQTKHERGPGPDAPTQQHEQAKITRYARGRGKSRKPVIFGIEPGLVSWRSSK
ncbi:MAG TPA: hypothetical protein VNH84_19335, partial [Candidatus Saccharimonadales bacterium]|nr:hypothetical protein [Candidatus Saccharimonadales bacterium]